MSGSKVFMITGTSTGFGNEYSKAALADGHKVVATARDASKIKIPGATDDNFLAVSLDVSKPDQIEAAFESAVKKFGRIDVLCNNAGFGLSGPFETFDDSQIRFQMEVNFFGLVHCTRKGLEVMREQKSGRIQQITSIGGLRGVPGFSIYCASKFAVEGFTEAVSQELKPEWNIHLSCIEPGGFRTEWANAGTNLVHGNKKVAAYDHLDLEGTMAKRHGNQVGDPAKAGKAMLQLALEKDPPLRIVLGSDAHKAFNDKLKNSKELVDKWEHISLSTDVKE